MEKHNSGNNPPNMQELMKIARTPGGQQVLTALRQRGGEDLTQAMQKASAGDYSDIQKTLSSLMDTPEMKALLQQFGR